MYDRNLHFHFTGIGGSGMSGIAEILVTSGYSVSGSDLSIGPSCRRLQELGVPIVQGHDARNLPSEASLLVYSSAVPLNNPELLEAKKRGIPVVKRAEVLAELMRLKFGVAVAGAHGKTTTTSMIGWLLEQGDLDPTVVIGGQVQKRGSGGRTGKGDFLVAEADESDRSFLLLRPTVALVTNVDKEHMSAYGSESELKRAFEQFLRSIPFYGLAIMCVDDPFLRGVASSFDKRSITYGFSDKADIQGVVKELSPDGVRLEVRRQGNFLLETTLPFLGRHLAQNALGAVAVALEFGLDPERIAEDLSHCPGVERRLEQLGTVRGITVFNDYGHHPVEIQATLRALRESYAQEERRLKVIFQPHRFSRTQECYKDFCQAFADCDDLYITEIYPAGEEPIEGVSGERLAADIERDGVVFEGDLETLFTKVQKEAHSGDVVLVLGAGSVGRNVSQLLLGLESAKDAA